MSKKQWLEVIKIVTTAIVAIATTLLVSKCTIVRNVSKQNSNSHQTIEMKNDMKMDSISNQINTKVK